MFHHDVSGTINIKCLWRILTKGKKKNTNKFQINPRTDLTEFRAYFLSLELGLRSLSIIPRVKLLASFNCLCSEGFIFPTSGSQTVTNSFVEVIGDGNKKFAPDSYISNKIKKKLLLTKNKIQMKVAILYKFWLNISKSQSPPKSKINPISVISTTYHK